MNYARSYDRESFTSGTLPEVNFIEEEIRFNKKWSILDVGCGTGRHSIELARRGYRVTGIDLSEAQLSMARSKASNLEHPPQFIRCDARELNYSGEFALVIMICEGAFPLMETDEMNYHILDNAARSLMSGGKIIFTTLNALYPLFHSVRDFVNAGQGQVESLVNTFDLLTFRDNSIVDFTDDSGKISRINCSERYYAPSEITWLLKGLQFRDIGIFGCAPGDFSRKRSVTHEDFEMLVIAEKA